MSKDNDPSAGAAKLRLDKWLWAARFFKTRSLAKQAIEGGKVHCDGARCKSSREIGPGCVLEIRQGWDQKTVVVKALSDKRLGAPQAALLYEETAQSLEIREREAAERKARQAAMPLPHTPGRPSKKDRRLIQKFKEDNS